MEFKQYTPYRLNYRFFEEDVKLKPNPRSENNAITAEISLQTIFAKIKDNDNQFSYDADSSIVNLTIGHDVYSLLRDSNGALFKVILDIAKKTQDIDEVFECMWLYIN